MGKRFQKPKSVREFEKVLKLSLEWDGPGTWKVPETEVRIASVDVWEAHKRDAFPELAKKVKNLLER